MYAPIVPRPIDNNSNGGAFAIFFGILIIASLIAAIAIYFSLERSRAKKEVSKVDDPENPDSAENSRRPSMAQRMSIAQRNRPSIKSVDFRVETKEE